MHKPPLPPAHYYGDQVRKLFVAGAIVMAASLPFYSKLVAQPVLMSIMAILILGVAAGLTAPKRGLTAFLDVLISLAAVAIFEKTAVALYGLFGMSLFFLINQILVIIFVCALYFGTKTLRGMSTKAE